MKTTLYLAAAILLSVSLAANAGPGYGPKSRHGDYAWGRVVDVRPVFETRYVTVQERSCRPGHHGGRYHVSHTPVVLGAVIGAALGHSIGDSHGDPTAAAVAGGLLGASVGRDAARDGRYRPERHCRVSERTEPRDELVGYEVSYRYRGRLYRSFMDRDPGDWVKLQVHVRPR